MPMTTDIWVSRPARAANYLYTGGSDLMTSSVYTDTGYNYYPARSPAICYIQMGSYSSWNSSRQSNQPWSNKCQGPGL